MNKNEIIFEEFENVFEDYFEREKAKLKEDKRYNELKRKRHNLLEKNKNLSAILEGILSEVTLTNEECFALYELQQIGYDMQEIESKKLFLLGAKEMYFFLRKLEIIE